MRSDRARGERDDLGPAGGRVGVAVDRVIAALVRHGEDESGRQNELDLVRAGREADHVVLARAVGGGRGDEVAGPVVDVDGHITQTRFAEVLHTVAVQIVPHEVAEDDGQDLGQAAVDVEIDFAGRQGDDAGLTVGGVDVATSLSSPPWFCGLTPKPTGTITSTM